MERREALERGRTTERRGPAGAAVRSPDHVYAALDLGTNNCRLLIARPSADGLHVVDSFSRIVRLGEGLSLTGKLDPRAIERTFAALAVCRDKMEARGVSRSRLIATEACRAARNGAEFVREARRRTGLDLEVVDRETEAHLAAEGCAVLADAQARGILLFDIGGGSSEVVWLGRGKADGRAGDRADGVPERIRAWTSLPLGVVSLADRFGGKTVTADTFAAMTDDVGAALRPFVERIREEARCDRFHLLGTSGTVTTVAGVHLGLARYDRRRVDGLWMTDAEVTRAIAGLLAMPFEARVAHGCIGPDRADLVLAGCAILDALRRAFPSPRLRIADRGLREGLLIQMMARDGVWPETAEHRRP